MNRCLSIDALAYGGNGVGRLDGKAVFVPLTAPGDRIGCRIVQERKRYAEAEMVELLEAAPQRRVPPCPVFGECGGCQWQHLPYQEQCRWKARIFAETLQRQAKVASTSEALDWIRLLVADDIQPEDLRADPKNALPKLHGALLKNEQDVYLFERLAFMARRQG